LWLNKPKKNHQRPFHILVEPQQNISRACDSTTKQLVWAIKEEAEEPDSRASAREKAITEKAA